VSISRRITQIEKAAGPVAPEDCPDGPHLVATFGHRPAPPYELPRCARCGGCHVVVIQEVVVSTPEEMAALRAIDPGRPRARKTATLAEAEAAIAALPAARRTAAEVLADHARTHPEDRR
jgi:hypothetical protein